jgi:hypothetical protein
VLFNTTSDSTSDSSESMATDVSNTGENESHRTGASRGKTAATIGQSASATMHSISVPDLVCSQHSGGGVLWSCVTFS